MSVCENAFISCTQGRGVAQGMDAFKSMRFAQDGVS